MPSIKIKVKSEPLEAGLGSGSRDNLSSTERRATPVLESMEVAHKEQVHIVVDGAPVNDFRNIGNADEPTTMVGGLFVRSSEYSNWLIVSATATTEYRGARVVYSPL